MKTNSPTIFYICNDVERGLGLELILPNYHIVCIDDNPIIDHILEKGGKVFSLERELNVLNPIFRNSNKLLQHELVQKYIRENTPEGKTPNVMFFKIAPNLERTCKDLGYKVLNTTAELNRKFELKLSQYEQLIDLGVNFPITIIAELGSVTYDELVETLGPNFVIQYDRGHTGSSTVFVNNSLEFENEQNKFPKRIARISKRIEGDAWTINACVTRLGILYGGLSYQITGVEECTSQEGGTVGNNWVISNQLSSNAIRQIEDITAKVGGKMRTEGFQGLFGLDFVINKEDEVFLIEVNARQPASTGMHTKLMLKQGLVPLEAFHIAEFLYKNDSDYLSFIREHFGKNITKLFSKLFVNSQNKKAIQPISASQIIIRNTNSEDALIQKNLNPGVYHYGEPANREHGITLTDESHKALIRIKHGYSIEDMEDDDGMMILTASQGHKISPGNEIARIQAPFSLTEISGTVKPLILEIIRGIKERLI